MTLTLRDSGDGILYFSVDCGFEYEYWINSDRLITKVEWEEFGSPVKRIHYMDYPYSIDRLDRR